MSYQQDQSFLVFAEQIRALAGEMGKLAVTEQEAQRLQDVARGRYQMVTIAMMREIAGRDPEMSDRFAEAFRPECRVESCVSAAFDHENIVNGRTTVAQARYERFKCKATWLAAFDELSIQLGATLRAKKAMLAERSRVWQ